MPRNNGSPNGTTDSRHRLFLTLIGFLRCFSGAGEIAARNSAPTAFAVSRSPRGTRHPKCCDGTAAEGDARTCTPAHGMPKRPNAGSHHRATTQGTADIFRISTEGSGTGHHGTARGTGGAPVPSRHAAVDSGRTASAAGRIPIRAVLPAVHGRRAVRCGTGPALVSSGASRRGNTVAFTCPLGEQVRENPPSPSRTARTNGSNRTVDLPDITDPHRRPFAPDTNETSPPEQKWLIHDFSHRCRKREREKSTHYWQVSLAVVSDSYPWKLSRQFGVATVFTPSHTIATPQGFTERNFEPQLP